ncbi:MAG: ABC transporter ATP-binding protein/permease [Deltaproteobacteria bacterium]|jgi:ATP-binding cassette subfamily B protein|nr:ABC transporter ATP-binding protein/permease [Deltaproteobacteria bacterium]
MLKAMRVVAGNLRQLRFLILGQIIHTLLTGAPVAFLFLVVAELIKPLAEIRSLNLIIYCALTTAIMVVNLFLAIRVYLNNYLKSVNLTTNARLRLADHLRLLSLGFFKRRDPGDISALMLQDMAKVEVLFSHLFFESVAFIVLPALLAFCFLFQDLRLTALILASVAIAIPGLIIGQKAIDYLGLRQINSRNRASSRILEYLQGISALKAFSMTGKAFTRLNQALLTLKKDCVYLEGGASIPLLVFATILDFGQAALIAYAVYLLFHGQIAVVVFILFMVIGVKFFEPILSFTLFYSEFRYMNLAANRIATILDEKPLPEKAVNKTPNSYEITFEDVSFGYDPRRKILENLNLSCPEKALTALVGPSGSGKTTLTSLLARFWDVDSGRILIGGVDVKDLKNPDLNALFGFVFQDVYLFQDTVLDNIKVGRKEATEEEVVAAAKLAQCHDFILKMENGYQTRVGEGGSTLSGGERQRISIARAILKNAPIVILDEATASIDPENELNVQGAIGALIKEKTILVIAHRLRTIVTADQIIVLEKGSVREKGTHEELLARGDMYAGLWAEQQKTGGWKFAKKG